MSTNVGLGTFNIVKQFIQTLNQNFMKSYLLKIQILLLLFVGMMITSCTDNNESINDATAESYAEETVFRSQESGNLGRFGCYELVFPVTLTFADASTQEIASYEELKAAVKEWRKSNPKVKTRPRIAFPYEVINADGEVITVDSEEAQRTLRQACPKNFFGNNGPKGHDGRPKLCFKINFPYSVTLPDGTLITLNAKEDRKLLRDAIKAFKEANMGVRFRPVLVFPISVTMEDGTVVTVESKEALKALKESCK